MAEIIKDSKLSSMLKKFINKSDELRKKLPNLYYCGARIVHFKHEKVLPAVFILKNESNEIKMFGHTACHSAWACPRCTPEVMAKKGTNIACAIDALAKQHNLYAFMTTFTLPHTKYMQCNETFQILLQTWRYFTREGQRKEKIKKYKLKLDIDEKNTRGGKAVGKKGEEKVYKINIYNPYAQFRKSFNITHHVKVYEFVWSEENGWHPHIHMLFWTKKEAFKTIIDDEWEKRLTDHWWKCLHKAASAVYKKLYPNEPEQNKNRVEELLADWKKYPKTGHRNVFFSKDEHGALKPTSSSLYISGWTGDYELTNQKLKTGENLKEKRGKGTRITPFQMLELANQETDIEQKNRWLHLFTEYAITTYKHRRCEFSSRSGITQIINNWKKTVTYVESYKKKFMDKAEKWEMAYWFDEKQWLLISWLEITTNNHIISEILTRAPNKQKLEEYLINLEIPLTTKKHPQEKLITDIFNDVFNRKTEQATNKTA